MRIISHAYRKKQRQWSVNCFNCSGKGKLSEYCRREGITLISALTLSQYAALEAFDETYLEKVQTTFKHRRDYLYGELKEIFDIPVKPEGAFYIWADISRYSDDSFAFARELLENAHIAVTPGFDFGTNQTDRYIRFAYARDMEHLKEGVQRLKVYLQQLTS